jgi:hypothetical protein
MESMDGKSTKRRPAFAWVKLVVSLALPLAVGIFTLVTTLQKRHIVQQYRDQDKQENDYQHAHDKARVEDEQRETVYVDYINDIYDSSTKMCTIGHATSCSISKQKHWLPSAKWIRTARD